MSPKREPAVNPLLSKNIPPPPPASAAPPAQPVVEKGPANVSQSTIAEPEQKVKGATKKPPEDLATVELSLYLKPSQDDKIEDLRRAYKRRTGKKISANELMRRLIDRATLESILQNQE